MGEATDFKRAYDVVERHVEERYRIPVSISDVLTPNTGDFDGTRILIDYDMDLETAFFVLIHLFGHTVQWNISEEFRVIGQDARERRNEAEMQAIYAYERDATRYSLQLMRESGIDSLDRWASDWFHADWLYLQHFYRTGEKLEFKTLLKPGAGELLTPLAIPEFHPQRWVSRFSF